MQSASRIVRGVIARQSQLMQELFSGATSFDAVLLQPRLAVTMLLTTLMCGAVKCCSVERYHCLKMKLLLASALRALAQNGFRGLGTRQRRRVARPSVRPPRFEISAQHSKLFIARKTEQPRRRALLRCDCTHGYINLALRKEARPRPLPPVPWRGQLSSPLA